MHLPPPEMRDAPVSAAMPEAELHCIDAAIDRTMRSAMRYSSKDSSGDLFVPAAHGGLGILSAHTEVSAARLDELILHLSGDSVANAAARIRMRAAVARADARAEQLVQAVAALPRSTSGTPSVRADARRYVHDT